MTDAKIAYEQHPVAPERKAELRAKGYKILDIRFKPEDEKPEPKPKAPPKAKPKVVDDDLDTF